MNFGDYANRLAEEARARVLIDRQLTDAGWSVQDSGPSPRPARGPAHGVDRGEAARSRRHVPER